MTSEEWTRLGLTFGGGGAFENFSAGQFHRFNAGMSFTNENKFRVTGFMENQLLGHCLGNQFQTLEAAELVALTLRLSNPR